MIIFWRIRYLDRNDRKFKDRDIFLDTASLSPAERAAVELVLETNAQQEFIRFRPLFTEDNSPEAAHRWLSGASRSFVIPEYFEDENGIALSSGEMGEILAGHRTPLFHAGTEQHHIDYTLGGDTSNAPIDGFTLSDGEISLLAYFRRDLLELQASVFLQDHPGTLSFRAADVKLTTVATDDEIRSFVTIFRRLYMKTEQANFLKATDLFVRKLGTHPRSKWVAGEKATYERRLDDEPWFPPLKHADGFQFTHKRLIDVFIYTQYAHQPQPNRQRQFEFCLSQVGGRGPALMWLFLNTIHELARRMIAAGKQIISWFDRYCQHHQITPAVLDSILNDNPGLGSQERQADRQARLFREKVEQLAKELWLERGSPIGGPTLFLTEAKETLERYC